jgi:hypothetical protein
MSATPTPNQSRASRAPWAICAALFASACGWSSLDALVLPGPTADAASATLGLSPDATIADVDSATSEGAMQSGALDAETPAATDGETDTEPSTLPCTVATPTVQAWTFDSSVQGWTLSLDSNVQASLTWTDATGDPSFGALQVDVTPSVDAGTNTGGWVEYSASLGDLSSRTISAWAWLDMGAAPHLKLFVQTGSQYAWADNGTTFLSPHAWTCLSLRVASPAYEQAMYAPDDVISVGFEMLGATPFRLFIDSVQIH